MALEPRRLGGSIQFSWRGLVAGPSSRTASAGVATSLQPKRPASVFNPHLVWPHDGWSPSLSGSSSRPAMPVLIDLREPEWLQGSPSGMQIASLCNCWREAALHDAEATRACTNAVGPLACGSHASFASHQA